MPQLQVNSNNESEEENDDLFPDIPLDSTIALNFKVLRVCGYWPPDRDENAPKTLKHHLYSVYAVFSMTFCFGLYLICEWIEMYSVFGDIQEMIEVSILTLMHFAQIFKIYYWLINRQVIKDMRRWVNIDMFKPRNRKQFDMMVLNMKLYNYCYKIFLSLGTIACSMWAIFPQFNDQKVLPHRTWSPFNRTTTPGYEVCIL